MYFDVKVTFSEDQSIRDLPWDQKLFAGKIFKFSVIIIFPQA